MDRQLSRTVKMCPFCGKKSAVYRSVEQMDGSVIRRRICRACGAKYETVEKFSQVLYMARQDGTSVLKLQ